MENENVGHLILSLIIVILFGAITAYYAERRGRNPWGWFIMGFLFGILGLLALFILPNKNSESKQSSEKLNGEDFAPPISPNVPKSQENYSEKLWYYIDQEQKQEGPFQFEVLKSLWKDNKLSSSVYVWSAGMSDWKQIYELHGLTDLLDS